MTEKKVMVFGTFDGLHDGHRYFLNQAKQFGTLRIVVAPNEHVVALKGHGPKHPLESRIAALQNEYPEEAIVQGDSMLETWDVIRTFAPEVIVLGYDQKELMLSLLKAFAFLPQRPEIVVVKPFKPEEFKSSKLNSA